MTISVPTQAFREARWIVSPVAGEGTHTTITAATAAASSGDTIFIRPGTYTENFSAKAGVTYSGYVNISGDPNPVMIKGKVTLPGGGGVSQFSNLHFESNADYCLTDAGAGFWYFSNCSFFSRSTGIVNLTSSGVIDFYNGQFNQGDNAIPIFTLSGDGNVFIFGGNSSNNGYTNGTNSIQGKLIMIAHMWGFNITMVGSGAGGLEMYNCSNLDNSSYTITLTTTSTATISNCKIDSGASACVTANAGTTATITNCRLKSSAGNALTGAGTINYSGCTFTSTATTNATSEAYYPLTVKQGGTNASTFTAYAPIIAGTTSTGAFQSASTGLGTAGFVLTSNGSAAVPSFQALATGGFTWTDVTGASQTIAAANGYITNRGGGVNYTLPASASLGDTFKIVGKAGITTVTPNANQQIVSGSANGAVGVTGTFVGNNAGDCAEFVCITAGASCVFRTDSLIGTWTLTT